MKVHFDKFSLATVIAVKDLTKLEDVVLSMNTSKEKSISVIIEKSKVIKYIECRSGLYYHDTEQPERHIGIFNNTNKMVEQYSMLQTVQENKKFTQDKRSYKLRRRGNIKP